MPTDLYLAPAASGKTAYLVARARELAQGLRALPRVVVPSQLQARAWQQRLAATGGALGVRVGTFDALYREVLAAAGRDLPRCHQPHHILTDAAGPIPGPHARAE